MRISQEVLLKKLKAFAEQYHPEIKLPERFLEGGCRGLANLALGGLYAYLHSDMSQPKEKYDAKWFSDVSKCVAEWDEKRPLTPEWSEKFKDFLLLILLTQFEINLFSKPSVVPNFNDPQYTEYVLNTYFLSEKLTQKFSFESKNIESSNERTLLQHILPEDKILLISSEDEEHMVGFLRNGSDYYYYDSNFPYDPDGDDQGDLLKKAEISGFIKVSSDVSMEDLLKAAFNLQEGARDPLHFQVVGFGKKVNYPDPIKILKKFHTKDEVDFGQPLVVSAIQQNNPPLLSALLGLGSDPDKGVFTNLSPLMIVTKENRLDFVKILLEHHADPNKVDAKLSQHDEMVRYLPIAPENEGITPLMVAAQNGNFEIAKELIAHGADRLQKDRKGKTALDYYDSSRGSSSSDSELRKLLVFNQANKITVSEAPESTRVELKVETTKDSSTMPRGLTLNNVGFWKTKVSNPASTQPLNERGEALKPVQDSDKSMKKEVYSFIEEYTRTHPRTTKAILDQEEDIAARACDYFKSHHWKPGN